MLRFCILSFLLTLLSPSLLAHALARSDGVIGETKGKSEPQYATSLYGGEGCSDAAMESIRAGFAEMTLLYAAAIPFDEETAPGFEYFGPSDRISDYFGMIDGNFQRAAAYGTLKGEPGVVNKDIHVRCDDPMRVCEEPRRKRDKRSGTRDNGHTAYNIANEPHVVFCKQYFDVDRLDKRVDKTANNQMKKDRIMEYFNRGKG